ncbi:MAG: phage tail tape measure protein, partial [Acidimicrobiia bacterium]
MATIAELLIGIGIDPKGIENAGTKLAPVAKAAGVALGGAMMAGAFIGMEREAVGDKVAAQLRLTEPEAKQAGDIAGRLYADAYGESFGQASEAVGAVIGTFDDLDPAGVERVSAKVLDLASAFDLDVTDSVARVGALLEGGLARDADHAMDLITASFQTVAPGLRDELADATREYSKHFGDLGITGEETFGLLAAADDQFTLDKTGDAIKELSIRATDMSALSVGAFDAMDLDAEDMADRILAGGDTARGAFDQIIDGLLSIEDPTEQANTAIALFGTPIEDIGTAKIPAFLESLDSMESSLGDVSGRAEEMGDVLNDNAKTKIDGAKRSVEGFLAKIVEAPGLLGDMTTGAAGIASAFQPVAPMMTGLAIVFQGQLGKMASSMGSTVATVARHAGSFIAHYARMAAASLISAAKVAASWVIAMGPVGWVIAGVVALVALIVANWDTVKKWTKAAWEWVSEKIAAVWGWIKDTVSGGVTAVIGFFTNLRDKIVEAVTKAKDWVLERFESLKDGAIDTVVALLDWWKGLPGRLIEALGNLGMILWDAGKSIVTGLWEGIKSMGSWLATKVSDWVTDKIPGPIASVLGISSPSKVTAGLGREVAAGLAMGMSKDLSLVERSAMQLAAASIPGISGISGGQVTVPAVSAMSGVSAGRANQQPPVYINNVYGWDD